MSCDYCIVRSCILLTPYDQGITFSEAAKCMKVSEDLVKKIFKERVLPICNDMFEVPEDVEIMYEAIDILISEMPDINSTITRLKHCTAENTYYLLQPYIEAEDNHIKAIKKMIPPKLLPYLPKEANFPQKERFRLINLD